jgi:ATP-dependent DNA ligase
MQAKIEKKMKEGYTKTKPDEDATILQTAVDLDNLPVNLCPNKPIGQSSLPDKVLNGKDTYGQRKHNGHCLILVRGKETTKVYTRRMENITEFVKNNPVIRAEMDRLPKGSFLLFEAVFYHNKFKKEMPRFTAQMIRHQDPDGGLGRYKELSKLGTFRLVPFDVLFLKHKFVGNRDYKERYGALIALKYDVPDLYVHWKSLLKDAEKNGWEGFVLRVPGEKSHVSYTMDGKAARAGSWKYKFVKEGDFFIDSCELGKSGKHAGFYAKFHVGQYDDDGNVIDRGFVGCGTLTHEELEQLTKDIDSQKRKLPFVVEIEYQSIHDESGKLEFGQIQRIRDDKTPKECIADE